MPTVQIPLANGAYRNVHDEELSDRDALLVDCYIDELGFQRNRPGLVAFNQVSGVLGVVNYPVNGIFWWPHKNLVLVVAYGRVLKISYGSGYTAATDLTASALALNFVPQFCTDGSNAFIANGGRIVYTNGTANTAYIADANCPTTVTHVAWVDGYLLAIAGTNKFYWSDVNNPFTWNPVNFASAASNADVITALHVFQEEIFLFGLMSLEVWRNDGVNPFSRNPGGVYSVGCIAPYSVVEADQDLYWVSDTRRVVKFTGGQIATVSTPYDKELSRFTSVSDCRAFRVIIDGNDLLVFVFPGAGRTLVYNRALDRWHEWGYWNRETGERENWLGNAYQWVPTWGLHLVGDRRKGTIYSMSSDASSDDGATMRCVRLTGHIDYSTLKLKRSEQIRIKAKRGVGGIGRTPKLMLRLNDDNKGFGIERQFSLGEVGDREIVIKIPRTGMYRTRQYEIVVSDAVPVVIGGGEEDITILGV